MGKPVAGEVVVVPFPFSDLTQTKRRPALVLADLDGDDLILCMITSRAVRALSRAILRSRFTYLSSFVRSRTAISSPTRAADNNGTRRLLD